MLEAGNEVAEQQERLDGHIGKAKAAADAFLQSRVRELVVAPDDTDENIHFGHDPSEVWRPRCPKFGCARCRGNIRDVEDELSLGVEQPLIVDLRFRRIDHGASARKAVVYRRDPKRLPGE